MLKYCASQLSGTFKDIFTESLRLQTIPKVWKNATIVPEAKVKNRNTLNDFGPVALTSLAMNFFF